MTSASGHNGGSKWYQIVLSLETIVKVDTIYETGIFRWWTVGTTRLLCLREINSWGVLHNFPELGQFSDSDAESSS